MEILNLAYNDLASVIFAVTTILLCVRVRKLQKELDNERTLNKDDAGIRSRPPQ